MFFHDWKDDRYVILVVHIRRCQIVGLTLNSSFVAVWFPISAFVALGLDHSVANMFIIPLGMLRGADITIADFFMKNLIPVTLGNIVGGALCVMAPFGVSFGSWGEKKT
jgi:formate transporter